MQYLLLRLIIRNNPIKKVWNSISSIATCGKDYDCVRYSAFCTYPSSQFGGQTRLSEVETVVKNIHVGRSEEEILSLLVNDDVCETISLSHSFVDMLLHRFRDDWKAALGIFRWAESRSNYEHLPETYDLMVDILGKARQFSKMRKLVSEMRERNLVSLNTVAKEMRRFSGAHQWEEVVRTFDELKTFGLEKNTESMNVLLGALCKENRVEMARTIFMELKSHISPNLRTFNTFIHGWCQIKRVEEADWTLQEMIGYGFAPCVISYSIIIKSYCRLCNWSKVYELLDEMKAQGCQPCVITYTTIISSLTKAGKLEDALKMGDMVKSSGYIADTTFYNAIIHTLGRARLVSEAYDVFKVEMPNNGVLPNTVTYNTLIAMFCYHGQEHMAFNILEDLEKSTVCKPNLQTFHPLLKASIKSRMADNCLSKLLDDMINKHNLSIDVSTYALLITGLCRIDNCEWAVQLFEEMIDKGMILGHRTCRLLLDEVNKKGMFEAADRMEDYIKHLGDYKQNFSGFKRSSVPTEE